MVMQAKQSYSIGLIVTGENGETVPEALDFSSDLVGIKIISSLTSYYTTVVLKLKTEPGYFFKNKIYGQSKVTLLILLQDFEGIPTSEVIKFDLLYVSDNIDLGITTKLDMDDEEGAREPKRKSIEIITICKDSFKIMSSPINLVKQNIYMKDLIEEVTPMITEEFELIMDEDDLNDNLIEQVCIPPATLINTFQYLDYMFGIYNGICSVYCTYDKKLKILNLSKRIKKDILFTINQLALDSDNEKLLLEGEDGVYYTKSDIQKKYKGNTEFLLKANDIRYVVKPKDSLTSILNIGDTSGSSIGLNYIAKNWGLVDCTDEPNFFLNTDITDDRKKYYTNHSGHNYSTTPVIASKAKELANLTTIKIGISRAIEIKTLLNIGEPVKFDTKILTYKQYAGKYIFASSVLNFIKDSKDWGCGCQLTLIRSNQSVIN